MKEVLSPAGSMEALQAAIQNGADAVYLGLPDFSARAGADNFTPEQLLTAISLCHAVGVKVYVALNTLIFDRELKKMEAAIRQVADLGADAIIVQDLATARLAREIAPSLPLHASTQMCIYSPSGAKELEKMGFTRAVLARELSADEVRQIARSTKLELEVFVHGALCMCYSGHCYFSSVIGRNSGNRGRCAQPCRLPYENGYPLSLKDLSLLDHATQMANVGVTSFKIEGRLKSAAYVGAVTHALAEALQGKAPDEATYKQLSDLFSRDGFTDGYWTNTVGKTMFGTKQKTEYADYQAALKIQNERKPYKRFSLSVSLCASVNSPCKWTFSDGIREVTYFGAAAQPAQNKALSQAALFERLDKLTDTPYSLVSCALTGEDNIFLPISAVNEARREGLKLLDNARGHTEGHTTLPFTTPNLTPSNHVGGTQILYHSPAAFDSATDHSVFAAVWLPEQHAHLYHGENAGAHIDHFTPESEFENIFARLRQNGISRVLVGNIGHIRPFAEAGFEVWGDYALNITNSLALSEYKQLHNACLSFELSLPQIRDMTLSLPSTLIVYGRLPLMQFKNCVICQKSKCIDHSGFIPLRDRKGMDFLLQCRAYCGNTLFNAVPLWLGGKDLQGFAHLDRRFDFTDETPAQVRNILKQYADGVTPDGNFTKGLYTRGVL